MLAEPGVGCSGGGHLPPTAGLIVTACAVIAPPGGELFGLASTSTQLPAVTSGSFAGVSSVIIVCDVKSTVAAVLFRCVRWIMLPDTELTRPSMWSLPIGGAGGGLGAALVGLVDVLGFPVCSFDDVLQATTDKAMAPVTTRIAARVGRGLGEVLDINVSPITGFVHASGYPP
ncbi:MAG: hypothetical protein QOI30_886 [Mycobacterium sp.]|nr:hypothetical protein [Mycobacterium sp.]